MFLAFLVAGPILAALNVAGLIIPAHGGAWAVCSRAAAASRSGAGYACSKGGAACGGAACSGLQLLMGRGQFDLETFLLFLLFKTKKN